jgi:hypothetical protein
MPVPQRLTPHFRHLETAWRLFMVMAEQVLYLPHETLR